MEYHLYIYSARVKHFIQHHGGWESHPDAAFALPKKFAAAIRGRLLSYGFAEKDSGKFEKMYGSVPVTVRTFAGSVIFSLPYPTQFEAQLFDIRLHAMEMTDMGGVSLYDPQADEWDFGLEE